MSMPKIPDITPEINITLEDSVNLLLASIAMEEISMSKLMDAEKNKILFVLNECENNEATVGDVLDINESVNKSIINLMKMQMLLQFKLENVEKLMPATSTSTTASTTTSTSTSTSTSTMTSTHSHTTTCTMSTCSTTTRCPKRKCCLKGKSRGVVSNRSDEFHCQDVTLRTFVSSCNGTDNRIRYYVGDDYNSLYMKANDNNINIECPCAMRPDEIKVWGKGRLTRILECEDIYSDINFELLVWHNKEAINGFRMTIKEHKTPVVIHDSGFVKVCCCDADLRLRHIDICHETVDQDNWET